VRKGGIRTNSADVHRLDENSEEKAEKQRGPGDQKGLRRKNGGGKKRRKNAKDVKKAASETRGTSCPSFSESR